MVEPGQRVLGNPVGTIAATRKPHRIKGRIVGAFDQRRFPCRRCLPDRHCRIPRYLNLGQRTPLRLKTGYDVYVRAYGAQLEEARILLNKFTRDGRKPEPLRLAGLAARAAQGQRWDRVR